MTDRMRGGCGRRLLESGEEDSESSARRRCDFEGGEEYREVIVAWRERVPPGKTIEVINPAGIGRREWELPDALRRRMR